MKYFIVTSNDAEFLEDAVINRMANGWELQGGISITTEDGDVTLFAQAMVKKEK